MRDEARALPDLFLARLRSILPAQRFEAIVNTFTSSPPTTFRVNTLKASLEEVRLRLTEAGFILDRVSWFREAFILRRGRLRDLQGSDLYRGGALYVQGLSSMVPPLVLDPQPGETVLDLAAAPGSKTTQIACLMRGEGRIVANDNNRVRFFKLRANVDQQGARSVETSLRYGETFGKQHPDAFDRVLIDAPCSAEGRFKTREPKSYRFWKPSKVHEMAHKQKRLLASGLQALRPGGVLVYSTCTFAPEENEAVVDWALQAFGRTIVPESVNLGFPNHMSGLTSWEKKPFDPSLSRTCRILPTADMEAFFIAKLRKQPSPVLQ